ncbi:hypothetical protein F5884DRAFT_315677 [Xylogone sp. PMI_703]|nr:hypothetical protein F5884DRAFT_315677 [Xylogone sp. PMI_703]
MTQIRKCQACRIRKIKCDEKKPSCSNCNKRPRLCRYTYKEALVFVAEIPDARKKDGSRLSVINQRDRVTFGLPKPMPPTFATQLASRWVSVLQPKPLTVNPLRIFGTWITDIPSHLGSSKMVDVAAIFLLDSIESWLLESDPARLAARRSGIKAQKQLRLSWKQARKSPQQICDLLLAIKLHIGAEIFLNVGAYIYVVHLQSFIQLFKLRGPPSPSEGITWALYESTIYDEAFEALMAGRDSMSDSPLWLRSLQPDTSTQSGLFDIVSQPLICNMARIPRLARLVRSCQHLSADASSYGEAVELLRSLSLDDNEANFVQLLQLHKVDVPTLLSHSWITAESWHFDSVAVFELVVRFYSLQILLCGITQKLCDIVPATETLFNLDTIWKKEIHAAISIARCAQYALNLSPALPFVALRLQIPLQIAYGTWHRLGKRQSIRGYDTNRADKLKLWCLDLTNDIALVWKMRRLDSWELDSFTDTTTGGAVQAVFKKRTDPVTILAAQEN